MQLSYNDKEYDIVIEKKKGNKNTYIRVKKDLKVHVTTNYFVSMFTIKKLIRENYDRICRMIDFQETKVKNNRGFYYLGQQYVVIYIDGDDEFKVENIENIEPYFNAIPDVNDMTVTYKKDEPVEIEVKPVKFSEENKEVSSED